MPAPKTFDARLYQFEPWRVMRQSSCQAVFSIEWVQAT